MRYKNDRSFNMILKIIAIFFLILFCDNFIERVYTQSISISKEYYKDFVKNRLKGNKILDGYAEYEKIENIIVSNLEFYSDKWYDKIKVIKTKITTITKKEEFIYLCIHCDRTGLLYSDCEILTNKKDVFNWLEKIIEYNKKNKYLAKAICFNNNYDNKLIKPQNDVEIQYQIFEEHKNKNNINKQDKYIIYECIS